MEVNLFVHNVQQMCYKLNILVNDVISKRAKDTGIGMALLLSAIKVNCVVSVCELIVDQEQEQ